MQNSLITYCFFSNLVLLNIFDGLWRVSQNQFNILCHEMHTNIWYMKWKINTIIHISHFLWGGDDSGGRRWTMQTTLVVLGLAQAGKFVPPRSQLLNELWKRYCGSGKRALSHPEKVLCTPFSKRKTMSARD